METIQINKIDIIKINTCNSNYVKTFETESKKYSTYNNITINNIVQAQGTIVLFSIIGVQGRNEGYEALYNRLPRAFV